MGDTDNFFEYDDIIFPEEYNTETEIIDGFVLGEDSLDFRDILVGDSHGEIDNYLTVSNDGMNTTIEVSMWGDGDVDHIIVLTNISSTLDEMLNSNSLLIGDYI